MYQDSDSPRLHLLTIRSALMLANKAKLKWQANLRTDSRSYHRACQASCHDALLRITLLHKRCHGMTKFCLHLFPPRTFVATLRISSLVNTMSQQKTYYEWMKDGYHNQYNNWMPWVEDQYLKWFTKDNKASYATKGGSYCSPDHADACRHS